MVIASNLQADMRASGDMNVIGNTFWLYNYYRVINFPNQKHFLLVELPLYISFKSGTNCRSTVNTHKMNGGKCTEWMNQGRMNDPSWHGNKLKDSNSPLYSSRWTSYSISTALQHKEGSGLSSLMDLLCLFWNPWWCCSSEAPEHRPPQIHS